MWQALEGGTRRRRRGQRRVGRHEARGTLLRAVHVLGRVEREERIEAAPCLLAQHVATLGHTGRRHKVRDAVEGLFKLGQLSEALGQRIDELRVGAVLRKREAVDQLPFEYLSIAPRGSGPCRAAAAAAAVAAAAARALDDGWRRGRRVRARAGRALIDEHHEQREEVFRERRRVAWGDARGERSV